MSQEVSAAQKRFDDIYMTSQEIQEELGISRATVVSGRKRGMLPEPILVRGVRIFIWEREVVTPFIRAWKVALASRRGELT